MTPVLPCGGQASVTVHKFSQNSVLIKIGKTKRLSYICHSLKINIMLIDSELLDNLTMEARRSPRLRMNHDLRNSPDDLSQRMLNAMEPGTEVPVHRHTKSSETVVVIRGSIRQNFYDEDGNVTESVVYKAGAPVSICVVPLGAWHNSESLESGTIIFEAKDGAYEPLSEDDIRR